ncbi:MAG: hypothetical protein ACOCS6_01845 [Desulfosalsimonas sp.]
MNSALVVGVIIVVGPAMGEAARNDPDAARQQDVLKLWLFAVS